MRARLIFVVTILAVANLTSARAAEILYDDTLGNLPNQQPWLIHAALFGSTSQSVHPQGVLLTTDDDAMAGYSNYIPLFNIIRHPDFRILSRIVGYSLSFQLQVLRERHTSIHRAGFSVILIGDDHRGIELGFWEDEVWAQDDEPLFRRAEGTSIDTAAEELEYVLEVLGDNYELFADGVPILTGPLRDYSSFGYPYDLTNFVFLGDDTSSGEADIILGRIAVQSASPIPEPSTFVMAASGGLFLWVYRRRKRSK